MLRSDPFSGPLLAAFFVALSSLATAAQPAPSGDSFTGILAAIWGDPGSGARSGGGIAYSLTYPDGTHVSVEIPPALAADAARLSGRRVVVRGSRTGSPDGGRIRATAIEAAGRRRN